MDKDRTGWGYNLLVMLVIDRDIFNVVWKWKHIKKQDEMKHGAELILVLDKFCVRCRGQAVCSGASSVLLLKFVKDFLRSLGFQNPG